MSIAEANAWSHLRKRLSYRMRLGGRRIPSMLAQRIRGLAAEMHEGLQQQTDSSSVLRQIAEQVHSCTRCRLSQFRTHTVPGEGNPNAQLVFVGEGPGEEEDRQGRPFVGPAGQLLNRIIGAMGLEREDVFIANAVKCRPPANRVPRPEEIDACKEFLFRQLRAIRPRVICALGSVATQTLLGSSLPISRLRGRFHEWEDTVVMPTYHPSFLLRNPDRKRHVWDDMKKVMAYLGLEVRDGRQG